MACAKVFLAAAALVATAATASSAVAAADASSQARQPTEYIGFGQSSPTRGSIRFSVSREMTKGVTLKDSEQRSQWHTADARSPLAAAGFKEMVPSATGFRFRNTQTKAEVHCHYAKHAAPAARGGDLRVQLDCGPDLPRFARTIPLPPTFWTPTSGSFLSSTGWFQYPNYAYNLGGYWGCSVLQGGHCASPNGPFAANPGAGYGWR